VVVVVVWRVFEFFFTADGLEEPQAAATKPAATARAVIFSDVATRRRLRRGAG
jgi:hypothetical protein